MKQLAVCAFIALAVITGSVQAQTNAARTNSTDPVVQSRMKNRDANEVYRQAVATANKERDAKVSAAVDSAVKDAEKTGRDPIVARRNARTEARRATKADFDAAVSAARKERSAARAVASKTASKP